MKHRNAIYAGLSMLSVAVLICGCASTPEPELPWNKRFNNRLLSMGKNNWIVIAEAGYSRKHVNSTEMLVTRKSLPSVLNTVLGRIGGSDHVNATAWISSEFEHIPNRDALEITQLYRDLRRLLSDSKVAAKVAPEQEIIKKMEESTAGNYYILILKTSTPKPYASVYLQLDYRYWDEEREKRLREALRSTE